MDNTEGSLRGPAETLRLGRRMGGRISHNTSAPSSGGGG